VEVFSTVLTQVLFIVLLIALPFFWWLDRQRKHKLATHYAGLGFQRVPPAEIDGIVNAERFVLLGKRWLGSGKSKELYVGCFEGLDMAQFTLSKNDGSQSGRQQTVTLIKGASRLPTFVLRPEKVGDKLLDRFKQVDVDFASHPLFSRTYQLEAADEAEVRAWFSDQLLSYLEQNPGYSLESVGSDMLVFREYKRVASSADIDVQLRLAHTLYQRLLEYGGS